ncbi:MAG: sugar nucleotide-binding protein [Myxococcota bacterium]
MRYVVTGASGTVGRALTRFLTARNDEVIRWDRKRVSTSDYGEMEAFLKTVRPDRVVHLAFAADASSDEEAWPIDVEWVHELAWACRTLRIPWVHVSTVLVFAPWQNGPFRADSVPEAPDGYGARKKEGERRARRQDPNARIVRLGWQIGEGGNQMAKWLADRSDRAIGASTTWMPACSFLDVTAPALVRAFDLPPGCYQVDSNRGWSFYEIASALVEHLQKPWTVEPDQSFTQDQRLFDPWLEVPSLADRLTLRTLDA